MPTFKNKKKTEKMMSWYQNEDEEEDLMFSPALMARRASESWIDSPPVEVHIKIIIVTC